MREFELIDALVAQFAETAEGGCLVTGIGDDSAVTRIPEGHQLVSSIDTLLAGTHFPADAHPREVGYRAMMVSLSDLAAMGATPLFVLLALTLPEDAADWATGFAAGAAEAARVAGTVIAGGNLTRGPLGASVSVHGSVPAGAAVLRSGARPGDHVYVSGHIGGAAAALRRAFDDRVLVDRFYRPRARVDLATDLRACASAAIDISDGLLQDLGHLARASGCRIDVQGRAIPVCPGATLEDALYGGDDYELCFTSAVTPNFPATLIGTVSASLQASGQPTDAGVWLDGARPARAGYQHFVS